ncbi:nucleolus and neural progenitor protein [Syngnathus scovelli]|uniref:nucleolus and neural progenitor protein n=1 Tax=Syngnathus scovelli TaxID=161590 RepID=UPI00210F84B4|nr:nucleolus and neural progenitor protein [Syngnathus scovelli]
MALEPWNRTIIPIPAALSSVRVNFTTETDVIVKNLLTENDNVLKVLRSTFLQTEVRVLYALLYNRNHSARSNKTFRVLKQVAQCLNRLKEMKLDDALKGLTDLCPNRIQRDLSVKAGEGNVPSQPSLEWQCLKVLGAAQLMSCAMKHCSRAFLLSKQHMKFEFVVLNVVITSMLSRFWVIFRGILTCLSTLYQYLLELRAEVALARPMPFLTDFNLPANMADFLGPSDAALLLTKPKSGPHVTTHKPKVERRKAPVGVQKRTRRVREDLGVSVRRVVLPDANVAAPVRTLNRSAAQTTILPRRQRVFRRCTARAATFKDMASCLDKMIVWCNSQKMSQIKRRLTFLRLKCRQMRGAEAAGYNVRNKLLTFKREAGRAFCGVRKARPIAACRGWGHPRASFGRRQFFRFLKMRHNATSKVKPKRCASSPDDWISRTMATMVNCDSHDADIDDIFASAGL